MDKPLTGVTLWACDMGCLLEVLIASWCTSVPIAYRFAQALSSIFTNFGFCQLASRWAEGRAPCDKLHEACRHTKEWGLEPLCRQSQETWTVDLQCLDMSATRWSRVGGLH